MYPVQTILLALLILSAGDLPDTAPGHWWPLFSAGALLLVCIALARHWTFRAVRRLAFPGAAIDRELFQTARRMSWLRWATLAILAAVLFLTPGHAAVLHLRIAHWPAVPELLFLLPIALVWILLWWCQFDVEAGGRNRVIAERLALQLPVHDFPTRAGYIFLHVRHNFYILLIIAVKIVVERSVNALPAVRERDWLSGLLTLAMFILVLGLIPVALTRLWNTVQLTGPLRARLDAVAAANRLRFRDIRIWRTHYLIPNAAILGPLPQVRYFLMTDALLEALDDDQAEAVFAHEVGHGVCHHIAWYVAALLGFGALCDALTDFTLRGLNHFGWHALDPYAGVLSLVPLAAFLIIGFSRISRQFEHQADWFATCYLGKEIAKQRETMVAEPAILSPADQLSDDAALAQPDATEVVVLPPLQRRQAGDLEIGARRFSGALEEIVRLSHRPQHRAGWMHPSPRQRVSFLLRLARDPLARAHFERRMRNVRIAIAALATVGVAAAILDYYVG